MMSLIPVEEDLDRLGARRVMVFWRTGGEEGGQIFSLASSEPKNIVLKIGKETKFKI